MVTMEEQEGSGSGCLCWFLGIVVSISALGILTEMLNDAPPKSKLDEWFDDYSADACEDNVKTKLRDPDSYKKIKMLMPTKISEGEKVVRWDFRARNGFGGYNVSTAECLIKKEGDGSILTTIRELN